MEKQIVCESHGTVSLQDLNGPIGDAVELLTKLSQYTPDADLVLTATIGGEYVLDILTQRLETDAEYDERMFLEQAEEAYQVNLNADYLARTARTLKTLGFKIVKE